MGKATNRQATSKPFEFDKMLNTPELRRAAEDAAAIIMVGELIRSLRVGQGLRQTDLAERTGVPQANISDIERGIGKDGPTVATLVRLLRALGRDDLLHPAQNRIDELTLSKSKLRKMLIMLLSR